MATTVNDKITITLKLGEVCDDVITACNLISKQLGDGVSEEIKADVKSPDSSETRSIVCRAVTEAIGNIKYAAQRYLRVGRNEDSNSLERLGYIATSGSGSTATETVTYENVALELYIPNFNYAVTDALKSSMHKYIVDYVMFRYLQNQVNDKAGEYKTLANEDDYPQIKQKLNARTTYHKAGFCHEKVAATSGT